METRQPHRLCVIAELLDLPESSNVKFYAQFDSWSPETMHMLLTDRGVSIYCEVTCGILVEPVRGDWLRLLATRTVTGFKAVFSPRIVHDFDPILFEQCLFIRRNAEENFHAEIIKYAEPLES